MTTIQNLSTAETPLGSSPFAAIAEEYSTQQSSNRSAFVSVLDVGAEALLVRLHLIRTAVHSIDIQTFIWTNDETGLFILRELVKAAERGVRVRLLIDHWVTSVKEESIAGLEANVATKHANLEIKYYNAFGKRLRPTKLELCWELLRNFRRFNQRMHNKTFIVDGVIGITGGRNYENDYYDRSAFRNFKDRDALVIGRAASEMQYSFDEYWNSKRSIAAEDLKDVANAIDSKMPRDLSIENESGISAFEQQISEDANNPALIEQTFIIPGFRVSTARFLADRPGKIRIRERVSGSLTAFELGVFLGQAHEEIIIQSPYFVLDRPTFKRLKELKHFKPNLDVIVSSNSLASTDNIYAFSFAQKGKREFLRQLRFRLFEIKPVPKDIRAMLPQYESLRKAFRKIDNKEDAINEQQAQTFEYDGVHISLHAKTFVVDKKQTWIGSFNLDPRSINLNTECALVISDEPLTEMVRENILRDIAPGNSWAVGKRKSVPIRSLFGKLFAPILRVASWIPFWPYRYASNYELRPNMEIRPWHAQDFHDHYYDVGPFPEVPHSQREIEMELVSAFGELFRPLV